MCKIPERVKLSYKKSYVLNRNMFELQSYNIIYLFTINF